MAAIWIDGARYEVDATRNLLDVSLSLGFDLPYFCWHPALGSVGACRQCAVKQFRDEEDRTGRLVMACMVPAADGARISIRDPEARRFRAGVIEWLMLNHPHDCPVCDEGGECHLQDMTVMTGHTYRRMRFPKRTYRNQYLGPFVAHEMNRCIQCYRCVRFYRDYAGGDDLQALGIHDWLYFGRSTDGTLESEFAGNLVEVCPTGVFTDKTLARHYTRKWDLQTAPSVCVHCGLGCNTTPGERYGELRRIRARYHEQVNGYFLCDRGRYGYEFVASKRRIGQVLAPKGPEEPASSIPAEAALDQLASLFADPSRTIGIGSPRASLESNFALRELVGSERFYQGIPSREVELGEAVLRALSGPARSAPLRDIERADAVFVLGEDLPDTAPVAALSLRQALQNRPMERAAAAGIPLWQDAAVREAVAGRQGPLYAATPGPSRLEELATRTLRRAPEDLARLGYAVARQLDPDAPGAFELDRETGELAAEIAATLRDAKRPLVISGAGAGSSEVIRAAAEVARAAGRARGGEPAEIFCAVPEANTLGLALLGGRGLEDAFAAAEASGTTAAVVLEGDLFRRAPRRAVERFLASVGTLVVLDHVAHETGARADLVLPAATFAESHGTLVSCEGRAQRYYQVYVPDREIRASWRWIRDVLRAARRPEGQDWETIDGVIASIAREIPALARLPEVAPPAGERVHGARIPREPHRASGRTARRAHLRVLESPPPVDPDSPYAFSMEGAQGGVPPARAAEFWVPGWNSVQALTRFQEEVAGPLKNGHRGVRLLEPGAGAGPEPSRRVPSAFARRPGSFRVIPRHHVFGSEELSMLSPGVAERAPAPYVALCREDAEALGVAEGDRVLVGFEEGARRLPVRLEAMPPGTAGLPVGLPGFAEPPPAWTEIATE